MSLTANTKRHKFGKIKNPKIKAQWLKDLRSGNYNQCQDALCEMGSKNVKAGYCCLGVLGRSIQKIKAFDITFDKGQIEYKKSYGSNMPPKNLMKEIGITPYGVTKLATLNDDDNLPFKKIADFIEENL